MPDFNWQLLIVLCAIAWAAWQVTKRARRLFRKSESACSNACSSSCAAQQPLVTLDPKSIERDPAKHTT